MMGEMGRESFLQIMAVVCRYLWTWHLSAHHVSQLGIYLIFMTIHFHDSCHSFESLKRMHCPLSHCVSVPFSHASKSFCRAAWCSKGIWRSFTSAVYTTFVSVFLSQSYGYYIHIIRELCSDFCVVDLGLIMALLRWDYSRQHQLIIQEIALEKIFSTFIYVSLNDRFSRSWHRFTSLTFDR